MADEYPVSAVQQNGSTGQDSLELKLDEFLECFPPPQAGRIVNVFTTSLDRDDMLDLHTGAVLKFHRQIHSNVPLTFQDPWGMQDSMVKVTLPIEFQGKFNLLAFDPESEDTSPMHIYGTVEEVIKSFPVYVQANVNYDSISDVGSTFQKGAWLKLIRLVYKAGHKYLECRLEEESRVLLLPMSCVGDFTVVPDNNDYTLADLVSMLPRRRRLKLSDDITNRQYKIPGLPANFNGELFMEEAETFVEATPSQNPGLIIGLPSNLDITVSPEEEDFIQGQLLNTFAVNNRNLLPMVVRVTDWDEETTILENHFVRPGVELVIHGWTRQSKILAKAGGRYYAVPLTYQGKFRIKPQQFNGVSELEHAHPAYKVKVLECDPLEEISCIEEGDVLQIKREDTLHKGHPHSKSPMQNGHGEMKYLTCVKQGKNKEVIKLSVDSSARFEEVLEGDKNEHYGIRELQNFVTDQEITVDLVQGSVDQKSPERDLPADKPIVLCDFVIESAVYVSVEHADAPAFHVPLRTLISVTYVQELEKHMSPLLMRQSPKLSTLDRCLEILPQVVFNSLREDGRGSEDPGSPSSPNSAVAPAFANKATAWSSSVVGQTNRAWSVAEQDGGITDVDLMSLPPSASRAQSVVSYDMSKPKGFAARLKQKFRKHKSAENLSRMGTDNMMPLSLPARQGEYFTRAADGSRPPIQTVTPVPHQGMTVVNGRQPRYAPMSTSRPIRSSATYGHSRQARMGQQVQPVMANPAMVPQQMPMMQSAQGGGYMLMPVPQANTSGYMMVPPNAVPPGYMLVPVMPQSMMGYQNVQQTGSSGDEEDDRVSVMTTDTSVSRHPKTPIPADGNLYYLSVRKMAEFLRQLNIDEDTVHLCSKNKIDGKKFSKLSEPEMDKLGLLSPIVMHFRRQTRKRDPGFML